jgi:bifunctional DNA-binding transcriptional regulator/antitoxin component of YhaV-PrlF toxin-antitoxin module
MVIPAGVRERAGLDEGTTLVLLESDNGLVLMTRAQLRARVATELAGSGLVDALLADRRHQAASEDDANAVLPGSET